MKQYNIGLKKWWNFCVNNQHDPLRTNSPEVIIEFLSLELNHVSYGSLNSYRSAISLILGPKTTDNYLIKRFMKGASNLKPCAPKYDVTWDPDIVLKLFMHKESNENLPLIDLSKKLITLLALITAHRMQTFSLINVDNIEFFSEKMVIKIPKRIKTSGRNRLQPLLTIPYFTDNYKICVATTLVSYLSRTEQLRKDSKCKELFLSCKKPYKKVGPQTLSRWVSLTLTEAGLDTKVFSAHSTRHAATSAAKNKGVSIDLIKKTAGWTANSSTFAKFYDRTIVSEKEAFANAIYN